LHYAVGDGLPRSLGFYFGSVIFFIGVLLVAAGISRVIAGTLDFMAFMDLISGVVLIILGSRAIRSVQR
jgi:threonine/homoserine/homoserine lactone efflux protein